MNDTFALIKYPGPPHPLLPEPKVRVEARPGSALIVAVATSSKQPV